MKRSIAILVALMLVLALCATPIYANTPGYWKNHTEAWDSDVACDDEFIGGPEGFTWLNALGTSPKGDYWYILARAYAAAYLNGMAEWDTGAGEAVREAGQLLEDYGPGEFVKGSEQLELAKFYATALDNWNNDIWD